MVIRPLMNPEFSPGVAHNVLAVADARESQRAGVPKGEPPQAAKRQPSC